MPFGRKTVLLARFARLYSVIAVASGTLVACSAAPPDTEKSATTHQKLCCGGCDCSGDSQAPDPPPLPDPVPPPPSSGDPGGGGGGDPVPGDHRQGVGIGRKLSAKERSERGCTYYVGHGSSMLSDSAGANDGHADAERVCTDIRAANGDTNAESTCTELAHSGDPFTWDCYTSGISSVCTVQIDRCTK